jgi:hypothetical protein
MLADLSSWDRVVSARPSHLEFEFLAGNHHVHEQSGYSGVRGDRWSEQPALGHRLVKFRRIRTRATKARLSSQRGLERGDKRFDICVPGKLAVLHTMPQLMHEEALASSTHGPDRLVDLGGIRRHNAIRGVGRAMRADQAGENDTPAASLSRAVQRK